MSAWIAQVDNSVASSGPVVSADNLRRTMGSGTVHVRAETRAGAIQVGAKMLGVTPERVVVTPYNTGFWNEVSAGAAQ